MEVYRSNIGNFLGNTVSDATGIFCAGYIEAVSNRMGLPTPNLTPHQWNTTRVIYI